MADANAIKEHMEVIGADGVHVGTVDCVRGDRIVLTKSDSAAQMEQGASGQPVQRHHYVSMGLVADIEGNQVRLSATGANAVLFEEEGD
ncbi:MAG: DUF2171 domain-containing protein [Porphyrobacter sp.]|nr:DUF2171 domain-containing protein [Porphyrobacter sp.]